MTSPPSVGTFGCPDDAARRPKVLHVDDSRTARHLIRVILNEAGFEVVEAGTGKEGLALAAGTSGSAPGRTEGAADSPDLILLDINLPDMSGLEVCRKLRADPTTAAIPIVHLSGERIEAEDQVSGLEGGADGYLTQPVERGVLVAYLKALLRTRRAEAELREHRDHLEELVRESAGKYRVLIENMQDLVFSVDAEGRLLYVSPQAERFGVSPEEAVSRNILEFVLPEDRAMVGAAFGRMLATGEAPPTEFRMRDAEGRVRWMEDVGRLRRDESGRVTEFTGILRDITVRKQAEGAERRKTRDVEYLSRTALEFAAFPPEGDIYELVAKRLKELVGDSVVLVSSYEEGSDVVEIRSVVGLGKLAGKVLRLLGKDLVGMRFAILEDMDPLLRKGELVRLDKGMYELAQGKIPAKALKAAARLLGVGDVHSLGMAREGKLFASATILAPPGTEFENKTTFAAFANQASVAFQRRLAEEALRESEERYRLLFEASPVGTGIADLEGNVLAGNRAMLEMTGFALEDLRASNLAETYVDPRERERLLDGLRERGVVRDFEARLRRKDGTVYSALLNVDLLELEGKKVLFTTARDVTDRKRTEEALRESEEKWRSLVENAPNTIIITDRDGTIQFINRTVPGVPEEDTIGRSVFEFIPQDYHEVARETLQRVFHAGEVGGYDTIGPGPHGGTAWYKTQVGPIRHGDQVVAATFIATDITDRKQAEDALRKRAKELDCLYRSSRLMTEPGKSLHEIIQAVVGLIPSAWQYPDATCARIIFEGEECRTDNFAETAWRQSADITVLGETAGRLEVCYLAERPEADEGPFLKEERDLIDTLAQEIGKFAERKRAERALHEAEEQFLQSQKLEAIGRLAGGVAHDFNNILGAIMGYSDVILTSPEGADPIRRDVEQIKSAADRAAALTRQLLAFSRKQTLQPKVMDLGAAVTNLEKMLRRLIGEDIELATVLADDLGRVKADPGQVDQVIVNLAVNSRDAMPEGGKLTVETANVDLDEEYAKMHVAVTPGPHVMLAITDTGCGMDEETRSHIFEPFFTTKAMDKGTGLGLSTVYGIVKQSGGNIWVYSEPGKGTTFKIYLPRVDEAVETAERRKPAAAGARGSETVLVVEDEEVLRRLITRILSLSGYKVLEARNGDEALLLCEQHEGPIHLMVTDVVMPQMGGHKLAERVASLRPEMKVAYMSGYTDDAVVRNGELPPDVPFIQKPFTASSLARMVREALDAPGTPASEGR